MNKLDLVLGILLIVFGAIVIAMDWDGGWEAHHYGWAEETAEEEEERIRIVNGTEELGVVVSTDALEVKLGDAPKTEIEVWGENNKGDGYNPDIPLDADLQEALSEACGNYSVPMHIALGVIEQESNFMPGADNGVSYGLMQLNRKYFRSGLSPADNIRAGVQYLGECMDRYDSVEAALTAYNAGHDTGARRYARAVLAKAEVWKEMLMLEAGS